MDGDLPWRTREIAIPGEARHMKKFPLIGLLVGGAVAMFMMKKRKNGSFVEEVEAPASEEPAA